MIKADYEEASQLESKTRQRHKLAATQFNSEHLWEMQEQDLVRKHPEDHVTRHGRAGYRYVVGVEVAAV